MDFEKLMEEEKQLEERLYGKKTPEVEESDPLEVKDEDFDDATSEENLGDDSLKAPEKEERSSWKKRFTNYKASTDVTLFENRKEIARLNSKNGDLQDQLDASNKTIRALEAQKNAEVDQFKDVFTPEDEELIGSEAVDIIKKAMKAKTFDNSSVKHLEDEIAKLKKEKRENDKKEYEGLQAASFAELKRKLTTLVPKWEAIDLEPPFAEFLEGSDPASGYKRSSLFANAVEQGDVYNVSRFYKEYQGLKPRSKEEILAKHITPVGGGSSSSSENSEKPIYSIREYTKFMDDVAKGRWRNRQKEATIKERQYDLAIMDGRMRN